MFDQQIEQARSRRRQQIRKVLLATVIVAVLCVAIGLIYIVVQRQLATEHNPVVTPSEMPKAATPENQAAARKLFQQQLVSFEQEHSALLNNSDFLRWLAASDASIKAKGKIITEQVIAEKKDEALTLFANSAYSDAIVTLQDASDKTAVA